MFKKETYNIHKMSIHLGHTYNVRTTLSKIYLLLCSMVEFLKCSTFYVAVEEIAYYFQN
jgi:hypothetical protein